MTKTYQMECPKCKEMMDIVDSEWISYIAFCDKCGYESDLDYYQNPETRDVEKMTKVKALQIGAWFYCPVCEGDMTPEEKKDFGMCMFCNNDKE